MEQRAVGRSGLRVTTLGLGTSTWGRATDPDSAAAVFAAFRDGGGTLVDTTADAPAEQILGRLLGTARDEVVLASRAGGAANDTSRQALLSQLDRTLRRLGADHLDLWQVPTGSAPVEETMTAVDHAVASGRVRYAGVADHPGWQLARAATWQQAWPGRAPIISHQVEYSLLARGIEREVVPAAAQLGVGLIGYGALAGGALVGRSHDPRSHDARTRPGSGAALVDRADPRAMGIIEAVATAADGLASTPVAVALRWLQGRPGVASVVVGIRTAAQLTVVLQAIDLALPTAIRQALDDVSTPSVGYPEDVR